MFETILEAFVARGIRFVLVGGVAATIHVIGALYQRHRRLLRYGA